METSRLSCSILRVMPSVSSNGLPHLKSSATSAPAPSWRATLSGRINNDILPPPGERQSRPKFYEGALALLLASHISYRNRSGSSANRFADLQKNLIPALRRRRRPRSSVG